MTMSALRLVSDPAIPPEALYECDGCATLCVSPMQGPRSVRQTVSGYNAGHEDLCTGCHASAWRKHFQTLDVVRMRKVLIAAHREGGWDAVARIVHAGVQLELIA